MIDLRKIKCSCECEKENCIIGLSFDSNPNILRFHDKHGNENVMFVNPEAAKEIIEWMKYFIKK